MKTLISVLGADIYQDSNGQWHTCDLNVRYGANEGFTESFRVVAASSLADDETFFFVQGDLASDTHPSIASVLERELLALGIAVSKIIKEVRSEKTLSQLCELQNFAAIQKPEKITVVTNEWHMPRVQAMIEYMPELEALKMRKPSLVAAEYVLLKANPDKWQKKIEEARALPIMKKVLAQEHAGCEHIRNGTYRK